MKANELRIGNWVSTIYGMEFQVYPMAFKQMPTDEKNNLILNTWKPIPITQEWLLKLGFIDLQERCGLNGIYSIIGKRGNINIETMSYCEIDYEGSVNDIVKIEYVHELQNLFYALNKEELIIK
jgi:hypothetical protein